MCQWVSFWDFWCVEGHKHTSLNILRIKWFLLGYWRQKVSGPRRTGNAQVCSFVCSTLQLVKCRFWKKKCHVKVYVSLCPDPAFGLRSLCLLTNIQFYVDFHETYRMLLSSFHISYVWTGFLRPFFRVTALDQSKDTDYFAANYTSVFSQFSWNFQEHCHRRQQIKLYLGQILALSARVTFLYPSSNTNIGCCTSCPWFESHSRWGSFCLWIWSHCKWPFFFAFHTLNVAKILLKGTYM